MEEAIRKKIIARLAAQLKGVAFALEVIEGENVNKSLQQYLECKPADLLSMMPQHPNILDRLLKGVLPGENF